MNTLIKRVTLALVVISSAQAAAEAGDSRRSNPPLSFPALKSVPDVTSGAGFDVTADMIVYPDHVEDASGKLLSGLPEPYPHVWALEHTGTGPGKHGFQILLKPGVYGWFYFDDTEVNDPRAVKTFRCGSETVVVEGEAGVEIASNPVYGHTLAVLAGGPGHCFNDVHFVNVKFNASLDAGIFFGYPDDAARGVKYSGWQFRGCEIDGGWDWVLQTGLSSKWGFTAWALEDFLWEGGSVHDVKREHAFYFRNSLGDVTIRNALIYQVGRTACQFAARIEDAGAVGLPANPGNITVESNIIADTGLEDGGQAITVTGRNRGLTTISANLILHGYDAFQPGINALHRPGQGSIFTWANDLNADGTVSDNLEPSFSALVKGNLIAYADNQRIEAVHISAMEYAWVEDNVIVNGSPNKRALRFGYLVDGEVDPVHPPPDSICITGNELVGGEVFYLDTKVTLLSAATGELIPFCP